MKTNKLFIQVVVLLCLILGASTVFAQNKLNSLRIWPSPENTRVVFDLSDKPDYSYFTLSNPERLVIDFKNTAKNKRVLKAVNDSSLIKKVRYSTPKSSQDIRVVLDLKEKIKPNIFVLAPTSPYGNRLVIDFKGLNPEVPKVVLNSASGEGKRDIIVAIDAGHGGEDPGSIGPSGSYEKNVTLGVAKRLAKMLNKEKGIKAVLTRSGDYYISPNKRPELARKNKADLFVSIHADAFTTPQPRGASVWVLSLKRSTREHGKWMEQTERHSELLGGAAEVIKDTANERYLAEALLDMSMDHSISTSYEVSNQVIRELNRVTKLHKRKPQAASLAVLTSPDIPSILVETGFISNPQEEKNLNWGKYRGQLANAIFTAIKGYFKSTPPDGTLWASTKHNKRTHKVRSGESLSVLAQRYKVPVKEIKLANNLRTDMVKIGQVLTIPSSG